MLINFWLIVIGIIFVVAFLPRLLPLFISWLATFFKKDPFRWQLSHSSSRSDQELVWQLRGMEPWEFEQYIADVFVRLGYHAKAVGAPHDGGIDVTLEKDGIRSYVQCKRYLKKVVDAHAVRDFYGAIADDLKNGGKGYFVTTERFTPDAMGFTEDKPMELLDMQKIIEYIRRGERTNEAGK